MNVDLSDGPVYVTLSRRNLLELLAELDDVRDHGARYVPTLIRRVPLGAEDGIYLVVEAQEDDVHYGDRVPGTFGMVNP